MSSKSNPASKRVRSHFFDMVSKMPPLSHWPDKSKPFNYDDSEVCKWILSQPGFKRWVFDKARSGDQIIFDAEKEIWVGSKFTDK